MQNSQETALKSIVDIQSNNRAMWQETQPGTFEHYLQLNIRLLHAIIEDEREAAQTCVQALTIQEQLKNRQN